jgi:hypothetical protein
MHYPHEKCELEYEVSPRIKMLADTNKSDETPHQLKHMRSRSGGLFNSDISTNSIQKKHILLKTINNVDLSSQ